MSTVVVVRKGRYAAIGADTLTNYGGCNERAQYIKNPSKILRIGESLIATVGHASWHLILSSHFARRKEPPDLTSEQAIFEMARELHRALKEDYFVNPDDEDNDDFESSRLTCLIANRSGIFGLYSLRSVQQYTKFYAFGSGWAYALGAMRAVYDLAGSAEDVALAGLDAGADFDDGTSGPFDIHTLTLDL